LGRHTALIEAVVPDGGKNAGRNKSELEVPFLAQRTGELGENATVKLGSGLSESDTSVSAEKFYLVYIYTLRGALRGFM
jgi:hypothetical protein